ncbi:hypothetical protein PR048_028370 [Dryococelus australis]|uniref:DDE Tnp4 domain-containing protein n=1 Tax=Dryococelus australis TaxID=614101 RepID=A0ABQ9GJ41_9NEOP|nr:hypothetical protein PR048_028370 [Dryococelus australis]
MWTAARCNTVIRDCMLVQLPGGLVLSNHRDDTSCSSQLQCIDVVVAYSYLQLRKRKKARKYWVHPYNATNIKHSPGVVSRELTQHEDKFHEFYRMSTETFYVQGQLVSEELRKQDANYRLAVSPAEKLLITIRQDQLVKLYGHIYNPFTCLSRMKVFGKTQQTAIQSNGICRTALVKLTVNIFALSVEEIQDRETQITKVFISIMLMAVADASFMFTLMDVGDLGRKRDGAVFRHSSFGKLLGKFNVPNATCLPQDTNHGTFLYYLVGDKAFFLTPYLMQPFPKRVLNDAKRTFNFSLYRRRKSVERAFGMLTSKFCVFDGPIACSEDCAVAIVKVACVLHHFIRFLEEKFQEPSDFVQTNGAVPAMPDGSRLEETPTQSQAVRMRNRLGYYLLRQEGAIAIQWRYVGLP